jgi:ATP-dependent protease ClpP protease subunit
MCMSSAGGSPYAIVAILDTIAAIKPSVSTIAFGQAASTATLLLVRVAYRQIDWWRCRGRPRHA